MQQTRQSWIPLVVVSLTGVALVFNIASLTTAIGDLAENFRRAMAAIQFAIITYSLLIAAFTITGGKLAHSRGARTAHLLGLALLAVGIAVVAFAPSINVLIAGQAIAGLSAAILIPSGLAVVAQAYAGQQRTTAVSFQAALTGNGAAFSLLFGGAMVSLLDGARHISCSWRRW